MLIILDEKPVASSQVRINTAIDQISQDSKINNNKDSLQQLSSKRKHRNELIKPRPHFDLKGSTVKQLSFNENDHYGSNSRVILNSSDGDPVHVAMTVSPLAKRDQYTHVPLDRPAPMLSLSDTFEERHINRSNSLLDRMTDEFDHFLQELEDSGNFSDTSTISTVSTTSGIQ